MTRGIGRDQRRRGQARLELAEQSALGFGFLDDSFDHEIRGTDFRCREIDAQACRGRLGFAGRPQTFAEQLACAPQCGFDILLRTILQRHP